MSRLRSVTPKARLIPLSGPFLEYLRADGIVLPNEETTTADDDSGIYSDSSDDEDPSEEWQDIHRRIRETVIELGGKVVPKLNWSAPKDATFMSATNDMFCSSAADIYLLLKSSDFITHDLDHAFDDTVEDGSTSVIPYHLVLRKAFNLNPALEFRCFVRNKILLAVSQREMNYFAFLFDLRSNLVSKIQTFLQEHILPNFPDKSFVFDVYIPPPHDRVWVIDINPWAPRTDPLLFSWLELLQMAGSEGETFDNGTESEDEYVYDPEFRLVERDDPEAYQFTATKYSAHKLPKEVVDASTTREGGMRELMEGWKRALDKQVEEDQDSPD
jgi:D123